MLKKSESGGARILRAFADILAGNGNSHCGTQGKRTTQIFFVFLFGIAGVFPARALTLDELQKQLAAQKTVRCEFEQTRAISGLARPLKSSGELIVSQEKGLRRHQKKPFETTLLLDAKRMVQTLPGQQPEIVTAESHPQLFQFNSILISIFRADYDALKKNFSVTFSESAGGAWQMELVPARAPLDKIFKRLEMSGAACAERLIVEDRQGDKTIIRFFNHRTMPAALTPEEAALFN